MASIPLSNGYYVDESQNISNADCLNLYPVVVQTGEAFTTTALRSPAGIVQFSEDTTGYPTRGAIRMNDKLYMVQGNRFYKVESNGTKEAIGDTISGAYTARVEMAQNGKVITVIVPGKTDGYFYDVTLDTFVKIDSQVFIDYGNKIDVTAKDGYFVYLTQEEFFLSSLVTENSGKDFDGLDFSTAELNTDYNVGLDVVRNELHIFGQKSVEVFSNTGGSFPFQRINGAAIDRGLVNAFAEISFQNTYIFIGGGENEGVSIWQGMSGQSSVISTPAIDNILQNIPINDLKKAYSFKYSESGNFFCVFTIPDHITLVYDATTSRLAGRPIWHRRASDLYEVFDGEGIWRVNHIVQCYGRILCFDNIDGRIGEISLNTFTDYDEVMLRRFTTGYLQNETERFIVPKIELSTQIGSSDSFGISNVDTTSDMIMKQSFDGQNFVNPLVRTVGDAPNTNVRTVWHNMGQYDVSFALLFEIATPSKLAITKLNVEAK